MFNDFLDSIAKLMLSQKIQDPFDDKFYEKLKEQLAQRVDKERFEHTLGVVEMAEILANEYDVDVKKARLAALLHDWDKCYDDNQMRERIEEAGIKDDVDPYIYYNMPRVVHGKTAAYAFGIAFPAIPMDVLKAISYHTTANEHMAGLEMVIFCADALEPGRKYDEKDYLLDMIGKNSLHELFVEVYRYTIIALLRTEKFIHPDTIKIWNCHLSKR